MKQTKVQGFRSLECHGIQTPDRLQKMKELDSHCLQKYYIPYETSAAQHARIQALRSVQAASELDGRRAPELTPGIVLLARGRMATGKAPGVDRVVVEMLHLLPVTFVYVIANIFAKRYSGECVEPTDSWGQILTVFLAKVSSPCPVQGHLPTLGHGQVAHAMLGHPCTGESETSCLPCMCVRICVRAQHSTHHSRSSVAHGQGSRVGRVLSDLCLQCRCESSL